MIFDNLLFGPAKLAAWLAQQLMDAAEHEMTDEGGFREDLLALQMAFELGDVDPDEFEHRESALLEHLDTIRKTKKRQGPA